MRTSTKEIVTQEKVTVDVTKRASHEDFYFIHENKNERTIAVRTVYLDAEQNHIKYEDVEISGDNYDLLMSESPQFAPGKPENEYREVDLWHIIDLIRT